MNDATLKSEQDHAYSKIRAVCLFPYLMTIIFWILNSEIKWLKKFSHLKQKLEEAYRDGTPLQYSCPGKSHGSLEGCGPWGRWGSDVTERLHFHFSLSCIGEGNGDPLQCSCLENPRDGGAWWAAVYGVAQSWTRLKWLSSSSSIEMAE